MKNLKVLFTVLFLVFITGFLLTGCHQNPIDVTKNIEEANKAFMEAFNNGDAHAVAMNYTEDAKLFPANSDVVDGQEAIETFWDGAMNMGVAKADLNTVKAESYGTIAVEEGKYQLYTKDDQIIDKGKYIVTWKNVNGQWKLNKDIWNTSMPKPFASAPEGFPVISEADRYSNALAQANYFILNSINYAKSKGRNVEDIAKFTGDQFKTTWDKADGYDGFVSGFLYNLSTFMPAGEFKMLERDNNYIKFSVDNIYPWLKNNSPQMNVSYNEYLKFLRIIHERIADYLGAVYTQETTPNGVVITISKK